MNRLVLPLLLLLAIAAAVAGAWYVLDQGFRNGRAERGGEVTSEERTLPPFTRLAVGGAADITLVQGAAESVRFETSARQKSRVHVEVRDGTLHVDSAPSGGFLSFFFGGSTRPLRATITFRQLEAVDVSGAVKLRAESWKAEKLAFSVSGEATLRIAGLDVTELALSASGAVKAELAGRATEQRIAISGAGNYRAAELASDNARVAVSGAGKVLLNVAKTLRIAIAGAGSVEYIGDPKVTQDISGVGKVRRRESAREASAALA
jgi:hypothetical protein